MLEIVNIDSDGNKYIRQEEADLFDLGDGSDSGNNDNGLDNLDLSNSSIDDIAYAFGIPVSNIILDDNGQIESIIDKDGEVLKGDDLLQSLNANPDNTNPNAPNSGDPNGQQNSNPNNDPNNPTAAGSASTEAAPNLVSSVAQALGLNYDHILMDDGSKIPFADMTPELQRDVVNMMVAEVVQAAANPFENDQERAFIEAMRSGKTPLDIARELVANDSKYLADSLSDFDLYVRQQKAVGTNLTDEELKETFEAIPEALRKKQVDAYRETLRQQDVSAEVLSSIQKQKEAADLAEFTSTAKAFEDAFSVVAQNKVIAGIGIDDQVLTELKQYVMSSSPGQNSAFINELQTEQGVLRAAFLNKYFDQYQQIVNNKIKEFQSQINILNTKLNIQNKSANPTQAAAQTAQQPSKDKAQTWNNNQPQNQPLMGGDIELV